jgi:hypothetical protein
MTNFRSYRALFVGTLVVLMIGVMSLTSCVFFRPSWQGYRASRAVEALVRAVEAQDGDADVTSQANWWDATTRLGSPAATSGR